MRHGGVAPAAVNAFDLVDVKRVQIVAFRSAETAVIVVAVSVGVGPEIMTLEANAIIGVGRPWRVTRVMPPSVAMDPAVPSCHSVALSRLLISARTVP